MRTQAVVAALLVSLSIGPGRAVGQETEESPEEPAADQVEPVEQPPEPAPVEPTPEPPPEPETETEARPAVEVAYGSMRVGLILQAGFDFLPDAREGERASFNVQRARLLLDGHLMSENLTYLLTGDATEGLVGSRRPGAPGGEMESDRPGVDVPFLLDAKITWKIPAIGTRISAGRYVPAWGLLMPERPSRLGAIDYPLYVYGGHRAPGRFRNAGLDVQIRIIEFLALEVGAFNGGINSWTDENDAKDLIAGILLEPAVGLRIRAASFFAFPKPVGATRFDGTEIEDGTETHIQPIIEARYRDYGLDLILGGAASFVERHDEDARDDYYVVGGMAHAGYMLIGDWFQLFVRGQLWDPDIGNKGDDQLRITAGPQLFLETIHSQIRVNYSYDRFGSGASMCRDYLGIPDCSNTADIPEVKRNASTVLIQATVDL